MAVARCETCGGRGIGLVEPPNTQCAHCQRGGRAREMGPAPQGDVLWQRYHLPQLAVAAWNRETRVLCVPTGVSVDTCLRLGRAHGLEAAPVQRATCSCAIDGGLWTWLRGCSCPTETWIEYRRSLEPT